MEDDRNYVKPFRITLTKVKEEMPKDYTVEEVKSSIEKAGKESTVYRVENVGRLLFCDRNRRKIRNTC